MCWAAMMNLVCSLWSGVGVGRLPASAPLTMHGGRDSGFLALSRLGNYDAASLSGIRNDMGFYVFSERFGHCTRCEDLFGQNATAFMARENVLCRDLGKVVIHQTKWTPVCDACATAAEQAAATVQRACAACDRRMAVSPKCGSLVCSSRRYQRHRRAVRRAEARACCDACGKPFTPARNDARFCSGACRQAGHRKRAKG